MAIIHRATLTPGKQEVIEAWLNRQDPGAGTTVELLGSYRFDDPAGEVGVEGHIVRHGDVIVHVPLTYRGAAEPDLEPHLVATMQHSALGPRWVYDATADPVARGCYERALAGEQEQAVMEVWDGDTFVGTREPSVRLELAGDPAEGPLTFVHAIGEGSDSVRRLVATWESGAGVVAWQE